MRSNRRALIDALNRNSDAAFAVSRALGALAQPIRFHVDEIADTRPPASAQVFTTPAEVPEAQLIREQNQRDFANAAATGEEPIDPLTDDDPSDSAQGGKD